MRVTPENPMPTMVVDVARALGIQEQNSKLFSASPGRVPSTTKPEKQKPLLESRYTLYGAGARLMATIMMHQLFFFFFLRNFVVVGFRC